MTPFLLVHRPIRHRAQRLHRPAVRRVRRRPQADSDGVVVGAGLMAPLAAHPRDEASALVAPATGKDQQKLVAADAAADVLGAQSATQETRHPPERLIARGVTAAVVDPLQVVDVGDQHRESISGDPRGTFHLFRQTNVRVAAAPDSGERILMRNPPERSPVGQLPPQPGVRLTQPRELAIGTSSSVDHRSPPV